MITLSEFVQAERNRYIDEGNNLFALSLSQVTRYYEFMSIITDRYHTASKRATSISIKLMGTVSDQEPGDLSNEQEKFYEEMVDLTIKIHLEIESFYVFSKTFLDKIALFIQNYFGNVRGISLISHDKLTKLHEKYGLAKDLIYPDGFSESLSYLKENICDYRDKQIAHMHNPRIARGTVFGRNGNSRIMAVPIFPNQNEINKQVESKDVSELLTSIDAYVQLIIAVIELNREKAKFSSHSTN